jgi:hypothetical protein
MQTETKSKTKRRSCECHSWQSRATNSTFVVLPRPVVINVPPIETQRTQRHAKPPLASPVKRPAPDPEQEAQWTSWTDELADIVLRPVSPTDEEYARNSSMPNYHLITNVHSIDTEDPAAEKETLAQDAESESVGDYGFACRRGDA